MCKTGRRRLLMLCALVCAGGSAAQADAVADFYKGRTVTVVVSSSAGGGYDTLARAVARHIGKHLPGHPVFVVRNMPGAGGVTASNFLFTNADKDGSVIGLVQNNTPFEPLFGTREARYDPVKFNWLGSPSVETAMVLLWHAVPVNSIEDLRQRGGRGRRLRRQLDPGVLHPAVERDARHPDESRQRLSGQNDVLLAMERRELDGHPSAFMSALTSTRPTWLRDKTAKAIVQYGPEKHAELGGVPFAPDLVGNAEDRLVMEAAFAPLASAAVPRPPNVPAERVAALRAAFAAIADPVPGRGRADRARAQRAAHGAQIQEVMERAYRSPPAVIDRLRQLNTP